MQMDGWKDWKDIWIDEWTQDGLAHQEYGVLTVSRLAQVRLPQLAVDGGREHGPLLHHTTALHPPRLPLLGGNMDEANHQLRPGEAHQQRDGRQGARRCGAAAQRGYSGTRGSGSARPSLPAQIILQSMHKYKPRVHVIAQDSRFDLAQIQSLPAEGVQTFSFQETEFTTVTAYQNQQVLVGPWPPGLLLPNSPIEMLLPPADHQAEDRQESLCQRLSGPWQEQVTAQSPPITA